MLSEDDLSYSFEDDLSCSSEDDKAQAGDYYYSGFFNPLEYTSLCNAVFIGDLNQVNSLFDKWCMTEKFDGSTLMHVATVRGHDQIVNLLCQRNYPVNVADCNGNTSLHLAVRENRPKVFDMLLKKSNVNAENDCKETPLHVAAIKNLIQFAKILLQNGANIDAKKCKGRTPLHLALKRNHVELAEVLLQNNASVNVADDQRQTPLHLATRMKNVHLVQLLLVKGAKINVKDKYDKTPLLIATHVNCIQLVEIFLKIIAERNEPIEGNKTSSGDTIVPIIKDCQLDSYPPLDNSTYPCFVSKNLLQLSLLKSHLEIWNYLLRCSSKIDTNTCSELHLAVRAGQVETVEKILEQTKETEPLSLDSRLAVYIAVETGNEIILSILLKAGYSFQTCSNDRSPLHIAATFEHTRMVEILLKAGANVNSKTESHCTPLVYAAAAGYANVVKLLLEAGADPTIYFQNYSPLMWALKRGSENNAIWIVTPLVFQNLLRILELLLIAENCKDNCSKLLCEDLFLKALSIRVLLENEGSNIEETAIDPLKKWNMKYGEFRTDIVRCFFNYVKEDVIKNCSASTMYLRTSFLVFTNPLLIDLILEYNDYKLDFTEIRFLTQNDECNLLFIGHIEDIDVLECIRVKRVSLKNTGIVEDYIDMFKMVSARLVSLSNDPDVEEILQLNKRDFIADWNTECKRQLRCMRETEVFEKSNMTFYDILMQPVNKIANYIRDENLLEILESSYMKFPAYAKFLKMSVEKGKRRKDLIDKCTNYIFDICQKNYKIEFSNEHICLILQHLSVLDMLRLSAVYSQLLYLFSLLVWQILFLYFILNIKHYSKCIFK